MVFLIICILDMPDLGDGFFDPGIEADADGNNEKEGEKATE